MVVVPGSVVGVVVEIDAEGYVHLKGRSKRFAKVGGEMISLAAVEEAVNRLWPQHIHAIIARPDARRGEELILFTIFKDADKSALISFWKEQGLSKLSLPRTLRILPSLPLLGSGKVNYVALEERGLSN